VWKHRGALWRRGDRGFAARAIAAITVFQVLLPLVAPLAIYSVVFGDPLPILAFWAAFNLFQFVLTWVAFGLDGEPRRDLWALPLPQSFHRQIMYLVVCDAIISVPLGTRLSWQRIERTGDLNLA
jgi:hypothetical protein